MRTPLSAETYLNERQRVTGERIKLSVPKLRQFAQLDETLEKLGIDPEDYVKVLTILLEEYSKSRYMEFPHVNVICSEEFIEDYQIYKRKQAANYVEPIKEEDYRRGVLLYTEILIATIIVNDALRNEDSREDVLLLREEFEGLCNITWESYTKQNAAVWKEVMSEAIQAAARQYGVASNDVTSYAGLANKVMRERSNGFRQS